MIWDVLAWTGPAIGLACGIAINVWGYRLLRADRIEQNRGREAR